MPADRCRARERKRQGLSHLCGQLVDTVQEDELRWRERFEHPTRPLDADKYPRSRARTRWPVLQRVCVDVPVAGPSRARCRRRCRHDAHGAAVQADVTLSVPLGRARSSGTPSSGRRPRSHPRPCAGGVRRPASDEAADRCSVGTGTVRHAGEPGRRYPLPLPLPSFRLGLLWGLERAPQLFLRLSDQPLALHELLQGVGDTLPRVDARHQLTRSPCASAAWAISRITGLG